MEEEEWRIVKEFKGYVMISSLGRIHFNNAIYRTDKGRVWIINNANEQKQMHIMANKIKVFFYMRGKLMGRNIASLVAKEFIPNPKNSFYVKHLNQNILDCRKDNLEWTESKIMIKSKEKGYRPNKNLMSIQTFERDVYLAQRYHLYVIEQYDENKKFVREFTSMRLVQRSFHVPVYTLRRILIANEHDLNFIFEGNYFKFKYPRDVYRLKKFHKVQKKQHINILQYTKDGEIYATWYDAEIAAMQNGLQSKFIIDSCNLDYSRKYYGGYIWRYQLDDNIQPTIDTSNEIYYNEGNQYIDL